MNLLRMGILLALLAASASSTSNLSPITINDTPDSTSNVQTTQDIIDGYDPAIPVDYFPGKPPGFILGNDSTAKDVDDDDHTKRDSKSTNYNGN